MTASSFSNNRLAKAILQQIGTAIDDILQWNQGITSADDYHISPDGMKNLAATSMLLEAIGEGVKRIDRCTQGKLLPQRPEIPWAEIMGMRDHIAHGYFDIDADLIFDTVQNDLSALKVAVDALQRICDDSSSI